MEHHTRQMETDTTTDEREILLQRAQQALDASDTAKIRVVRDQMREHFEMYQGDEAAPVVAESLRKLDSALGEPSPDAYAYAENDGNQQ
jgi:hypothetical protein